MVYAIEYLSRAKREVKKLPPQVQQQILAAIGDLADDPRPHGVGKLSGAENRWRIRLGS